MTIELVVFDWAGTLIDFGCRAPLIAFLEAFESCGLRIDEATARRPMGAHKRDHVRAILDEPVIVERARQLGGMPLDDAHAREAFGDRVYLAFECRLLELLPRYATPIPGALETLQWLRAREIAVGSTTGYTRPMMACLLPHAAAAGLAIDAVVCSDEVPQGRPAPWACFRLAERCGVFPLSRAVKVGDTPADMAEGRNAGMRCVGVDESGNEVGLDRATLLALPMAERQALRRRAGDRLAASGAELVLRSVAELPAWLEAQGV
ncbi:MAG: phosphonoacetaldehyde hydrolase [Planctomycetes bacterium]|nr:phosphonoacetaldehyde hydrolase [Planctomycetota bacterium]